MGSDYGYRTNYKSKQIKKGPGKAKIGKGVSRVGRGAGVIGLGLVAYNIHRHGVEQTVHEEAKWNWQFSPTGIIDEHLLCNRIETTFSPRSGYIRTVNNIATYALLEAIL